MTSLAGVAGFGQSPRAMTDDRADESAEGAALWIECSDATQEVDQDVLTQIITVAGR
jgi:hypothetical protein